MCKQNLQKGNSVQQMGMAASQARFLGLTARKSNVEFEGQQINQQRTTLANQSANYYNDLLGMKVPTPPSVDSFTKTVYTFSDGALTNQVTAMIAQSNGEYTLSYLQQCVDDFTPVAASSSTVTVNSVTNPTVFRVGATILRQLGADSTDSNDEYWKSLNPDQQAALKKEEQTYKKMLDDKYGSNDWLVRYVQNTTDGTWSPFFYNKNDIVTGVKDQNNTVISAVKCYTMGSATNTTEIKGVEHCRVAKDSTGRYISVSIPQYDKNNQIKGYTEYSLTTSTVTDQDAYDDAMNQYEYDKALYDQTIQDINSKIEIVQAEDKNLELRLKQLDTEQEAIQTEIESVSKVVDKNIEKSFNSFA